MGKEICSFLQRARAGLLLWVGGLGVLGTGWLPAHQISAVAAHAAFERDGNYRFDLSLDVTGSPDPAMDELVSPEEAALAYLRDALKFRFDESDFAPSFGPLRVVPREDPLEPGQEMMRLETSASGRIPSGARAFQVRLSPETEVALVMMVSKDGIAQRRAQTLFAGEVSRPIDLTFVGEAVRAGDPFAKEAEAAKPVPTMRDGVRAGAARLLATGGRSALLLVLIFLGGRSWRHSGAQLWWFCSGSLAGHLLLRAGGWGLPPWAPETLSLVAILGMALDNILRSGTGSGRFLSVALAGGLLGLGARNPEIDSTWAGLLGYHAGVLGVGLGFVVFTRMVLGPFCSQPWYRERLVVPLSFGAIGMVLWWGLMRVVPGV